MATGVNYWSSYEPSYKVSECVWGGEQESSSEEGGGGVTWDTHAMEVKGQLISAPDPLTCPDRKQRERMAELQERRRGLQALLSTRLAELRRICLQEAELTGAVPSDFPLEAGEKPPCVRRRGGAPRQGNRKCRVEEEDSQRSKPKKTLFSGALRKHSDPEHNTHTHHGKRTVHRGCHTDDTVRSESSSTSDSTGLDNDDGVSQCRPPLVAAGSPVEVFYQNKTRRNSLHNRTDHPETLQKPPPLPPSHPPPLHPPPPPPRSQDSSSSSGPSDPGPAGEGRVRVNAARHSNSSDGLLERITPPEEEGGAQQGGLWVNGLQGSRGTNTAGALRSSETLTDGRTRGRARTNNSLTEGGGAGRGRGGGRGGGGGYSEVLLDYVWGKQQQLQRQQSQPNNRQPITSQQQLLYNGYSSQQPSGAPPTYRGPLGDQRRVKVTRTKSCGPFLPVQQSQTDTHNPPLSAIQPDPHPHLLPPRPPQLPPAQDAQLEEATRSLHKALALEGLRDWYLRNTIGSTHQNQTNGKVNTGVSTKMNGAVKGQAGGGGALQGRRRTHGGVQQSTYQTETNHHHVPTHHKKTLPHSATFHGHPLHGRSMDGSLYHDFPPQKQEDQPSPGTLV
ncbi:coiled-coil domain-containing protein 120 [Epinephelus fuscoguttatus]|uniref:coiled-coil domain-containing protein 120 n=1 Tax=Epinephelus fuscoguttatus TaxID=293821 RepID=UPI0020D0F889|nr:coiled-coil domain-containing protein 120 [Epinephelus fuscoguttatus]XP_049437421.1 coiled-coil domain-containing protein 120 [Epinephelus fuscoguttatus]